MSKSKKNERFNPNLEPPLQTVTALAIIKEIKKWVEKHSTIVTEYSRWYCGISNKPHIRKYSHKQAIQEEPYAWSEWNAKSRRIAEAIETYFHERKMKDHDTKGGSVEDSKYVYVYKKHPTVFD